MKILIPMAGEGSRFAKEGFTFPKPLIDVEGKPMIQPDDNLFKMLVINKWLVIGCQLTRVLNYFQLIEG